MSTSTSALTRLVLGTVAAVLTMAAPALATSTFSPSEAMADSDVGLTIRVDTDSLDLTTTVTTSVDPDVPALACGAPDGWSCAIGVGEVTWTRGTSLAPNDDTFTFVVHTPVDPGEFFFVVTDERASGVASTSTGRLTVVAPEPSESATPSPSPTPTPTATVSAAPAPDPTPFRPPTGDADDPISIRDLPTEDSVDAGTADPLEERVISKSPLAAESVLIVVVLLLLATSASGFWVAHTNR